MYDKYTKVSGNWLKLRETIVANRKPRPMYLQPHMKLNAEGKVDLETFGSSFQGIIDSFQARFGVSGRKRIGRFVY